MVVHVLMDSEESDIAGVFYSRQAAESYGFKYISTNEDDFWIREFVILNEEDPE